MAVKIELKRSAVPGKVPSVNQLDLGELAINTYDGKVYLKQDTGVTQSVIELASASGSIYSASYADFAGTASYALTASYVLSGVTASWAINAQTASFLLGDLSRIASGSVTASISPDFGFLINTSTQVTGSFYVQVDSGSAPDFFLVKDLTTNKEFMKINSEGVFSIASFDTPPQVVNNGMYFDTVGNFYIASGT